LRLLPYSHWSSKLRGKFQMHTGHAISAWLLGICSTGMEMLGASGHADDILIALDVHRQA
jgi:hypothetical protein